jgi:hypothetical protein
VSLTAERRRYNVATMAGKKTHKLVIDAWEPKKRLVLRMLAHMVAMSPATLDSPAVTGRRRVVGAAGSPRRARYELHPPAADGDLRVRLACNHSRPLVHG